MNELPMSGVMAGQLLDVSPIALHGDRYVDVTLALGPGNGGGGQRSSAPVRLRISAGVFPRPPRAGDHVRLTFLLQQVTGVTFLP